MAERLLTTKLFFPLARRPLVPRPRLVDRLEKGLSSPFTLVSAPAGYGKTTLLSEWHAGPGVNVPAAWLSLDAGDNNQSRFLLYLAASLNTLQNGLLSETLSLLQLSQPVSPEDILTSLLEDLNRFSQDFVLVLDDLHIITDSQVYQSLNFLLDHQPSTMHLVVLTRADPPLPIARLRARSQLVEIRLDQLRFTSDEAETFYNQLLGLKLSEAGVAALDQRAEGWIAGLQLAGLSMQGQSPEMMSAFINTLTGSHHYILDYLIEEVLNQADETRRDFLLKTSVLDRLSGSLCSAVTGLSNGQVMLETLERANMFVIPLDEERRWYRYHHLFVDALRNRLEFFMPGQAPTLHLLAAEWYENNGLVEEAAHHALLAGDFLRVARLIQLHWLDLVNQGQICLVMEWLKAIPEPVASTRPNLTMIRAWTYWFSGNIGVAEIYVNRARQELSQLIASGGSFDPWIDYEPAALFAEILAFQSLIAVRKEQYEQAAVLAEQAIDAYTDARAIGGIAYMSILTAYWDLGYLEEAISVCVRGIPYAQDVPITLSSFLFILTRLYRIQGRLHLAEKTCMDYIQQAEQAGHPLSFPFSLLYIGLAEVLIEWNELERARKILEVGLDKTERAGLALNMNIHVTYAHLLGSMGDWAQALNIIGSALTTAKRLRATRVITELEAYRAEILTRLGKAAELKPWAASVQEHIKIGSRLGYQTAIQAFPLARVWMGTGETGKAQALLDQIALAAHANGNVAWEIEALLLQSILLEQQGAVSDALSSLETAITLAGAEGFIRIFLNEGTAMMGLLRKCQQRGNGYAAKLLSLLNNTGQDLPIAVITVQSGAQKMISTRTVSGPITRRETEVLRLMAAGCSNKEIASRLVISVGTVKRHVVHIFQKLNADNRTMAVAIARERSLIEP